MRLGDQGALMMRSEAKPLSREMPATRGMRER